MSSWTLDAFDNPTARDWVPEVVTTSDFSLLEEALDLVVDSADGYLEKADAERAMVAMETIAAALSHPCTAFTDQPALVQWLARVHQDVDADLIRLARRALIRIVGEDSELREYWEDTDKFDAWLAEVYELRERLAA